VSVRFLLQTEAATTAASITLSTSSLVQIEDAVWCD